MPLFPLAAVLVNPDGRDVQANGTSHSLSNDLLTRGFRITSSSVPGAGAILYASTASWERSMSVTGSQTKTDATVVIPAPIQELDLVTNQQVGDVVYVYGYSTPTALGFFTISADHTITVPLGALPKGLHKLAVINSSGQLVGWLSVTAGGRLASTGVNVNAPLELGGAGLLILVGLLSVIFVTRQRRKNEAQ
jgi:hypothetical protein